MQQQSAFNGPSHWPKKHGASLPEPEGTKTVINVDNYILGNELLHVKLCIAAEILAEFVMVAPRSLSLERLERYTGHPEKQLIKLCRALGHAGLIQPDAKVRAEWVLACEPSKVTLEDVFRVITAEPCISNKPTAACANPDSTQGNVGLLLMQAAMGIKQSVFAQLRQFPLDRLKPGAAGTAVPGTQFPHSFHKSRPSLDIARL
jgi:DNA-binding IscR family transcriptional regulator